MWSLIAFVLSSCISASIYSSIVTQESKTINTFDELMKSNQTIIISNSSSVFWRIKNYYDWSTLTDPRLIELNEIKRIVYIENIGFNLHKNLLRQIKSRQMAYITDGTTSFEAKIFNLDISLEISREKYFPTLIAYPINREPTHTRSLLRQIIKIMVSSGINVDCQTRVTTNQYLVGYRLVLEKYLKLSPNSDEYKRLKSMTTQMS